MGEEGGAGAVAVGNDTLLAVGRRLFSMGEGGAGAAANAAAGAAKYNQGLRVDDDNPIEIYRDKVDVWKTDFVAVKNFRQIQDHPSLVQRLIQAHKTYTADDFEQGAAPNGVFTFLVVIDKSHTHRLVAKEVRSIFEIGTRHHAIACDELLRIDRILCGGEIKKDEEGIQFNLQSGHYTLTRFKKNKKIVGKLDEANVAVKSKAYTAAVQALLPTATSVPVTGDSTFITEGAIRNPLDEAELHLFTSCGLSVFLFSSRKSAEEFQKKAESGWSEEEIADQVWITDARPFEPNVTDAAIAAVSGGGAKGGAGSPRKRASRRRRTSRRITRRRRRRRNETS